MQFIINVKLYVLLLLVYRSESEVKKTISSQMLDFEISKHRIIF